MKKTTILFVFFTVMIAGNSIAERYNYTWKDTKGVINITDYPPPEDIEIIDVRVVPIPVKSQIDPQVKKQQIQQRKSTTRNRLLAKAASLRKEEAKLRQKATILNDEAQELRRVAKKNKYKGRYRRKASNKERNAEEFITKANSMSRKAEALDHQASQLE